MTKVNFKLITDKSIDELIFIQQSLPNYIQERTECDIKDMLKYLPDNIKNIIDLGCGSGRLSIGLHYVLKNNNIKYWLVDCEDSDLKKLWAQYSISDSARFYNKRILTEHFCDLNNFKNFEYIPVDDNFYWKRLPELSDVLFSKYAFGWHFPIGLYDKIYPYILKNNAVCFFTIRHENSLPEYDLKNLPKYFEIIDIFTDSFHWTGTEDKIDCFDQRRTLVLRYNGK